MSEFILLLEYCLLVHTVYWYILLYFCYSLTQWWLQQTEPIIDFFFSTCKTYSDTDNDITMSTVMQIWSSLWRTSMAATTRPLHITGAAHTSCQ